MTEKVKETLAEAKIQAQKFGYFMRAKLGLPLEDEERGILIQPGRIEERTRVKMAQVIVHTQLRTLHDQTGFKIYGFMVDEFDRYLISLEGLGRQEYMQDRQPKVLQPVAPATTVNVGQQEKKEGEKKK